MEKSRTSTSPPRSPRPLHPVVSDWLGCRNAIVIGGSVLEGSGERSGRRGAALGTLGPGENPARATVGRDGGFSRAARLSEGRPPEASERCASRAVAAGLIQRCPRSRWGSDPAGKTTAKGERTCLRPLSERAAGEAGVVGGGAGESGPRRDVASGFGTRRVSKWKCGARPYCFYKLTENM
ncbi:hypothetical protein J1605_006128 [Eschrichtius robustus]|uniref:Uncharacterized protein n=1 Tax=Eschrichtius robustus TaxID=9764 RepID=A0AB34H4L1_ESCRO|nr:hypothetical protein J1605_006128 [Eschrichtius robustus]